MYELSTTTILIIPIGIIVLFWFAIYLFSTFKVLSIARGRFARMVLLVAVFVASVGNVMTFGLLHMEVDQSATGCFFFSWMNYMPYYITYVWFHVITASPRCCPALTIPPPWLLLVHVVGTLALTLNDSSNFFPFWDTVSEFIIVALCTWRSKKMLLPSSISVSRAKLGIKLALTNSAMKVSLLVVDFTCGLNSLHIPFQGLGPMTLHSLVYFVLFYISTLYIFVMCLHPRRRFMLHSRENRPHSLYEEHAFLALIGTLNLHDEGL